jgi:hypothetical protein
MLYAEVDRHAWIVVLHADEEGVAGFARLLRSGGALSVDRDAAPPGLGLSTVSDINVSLAADAAEVTVTPAAVLISGTADDLAKLAEKVDLFVEFNDINEPGSHVHLLEPPRENGGHSDGPLELMLTGPVP